MAGKARPPGLYEFLQEAELQHYYNGLKNILQVQNVGQLKYVVEEDLRTPANIRTSREVARMGSSISTMVELTADCPSSNPSGMMPCLDLQVWVEGGLVLYQHFRKPMANPLVMLELSAMPPSMKRRPSHRRW